ncbi:MAG: hypothetical protein K6E42_08010, partial [Synergistes sp.]|nr:hypothetical protein [Synergistes sp.]
FFDAASDQFLDLTLDYFFVQLYNLLGHGLLSPFRMLSRNFILPEAANLVSFYFLNLRILFYLTPQASHGLYSIADCRTTGNGIKYKTAR